jgi:hypothetical protein
MFEMAEPADAALAGRDPISQQLGVADQRVQSWFRPFGGTAPTGYLRDQAGAPDDSSSAPAMRYSPASQR